MEVFGSKLYQVSDKVLFEFQKSKEVYEATFTILDINVQSQKIRTFYKSKSDILVSIIQLKLTYPSYYNLTKTLIHKKNKNF